MDAAREYPGAQLDGFDLSTAQFPHQAWLPKNITLGTMDLFSPIPESLRGRYDVVHVGLLVLVVQKGDPLPVLDNLLALLSAYLVASLPLPARFLSLLKSPPSDLEYGRMLNESPSAWWISAMGRCRLWRILRSDTPSECTVCGCAGAERQSSCSPRCEKEDGFQVLAA